MYQNLPDNAMELVADNSERIEYVLCLHNMQNMLSGESNSKPFCMLTNKRMYVYRRTKNEVDVKTCALDDVAEIRSAMSRNTKKLLYILWSLPCIAFAFVMNAATGYAVSQGIGFTTVLPVVFWGIITIAALVGAAVLIITGLVKGLKADHAVMQLITKRGEVLRVDLSSKATAEIETFKKELQRVKAARNAKNEEVFW